MYPVFSPQTANNLKKLAKVTVPFTVGAAGLAHSDEHPDLAYKIPVRIITHALNPNPEPINYSCANRAALDKALTELPNLTPFDKLTIKPVNDLLHNEKIPLTKGALHALVEDMKHSSQELSNPRDVAKHFWRSADHQVNISSNFFEANETVGAMAHAALAGGFTALAAFHDVNQRIEDQNPWYMPDFNHLKP